MLRIFILIFILCYNLFGIDEPSVFDMTNQVNNINNISPKENNPEPKNDIFSSKELTNIAPSDELDDVDLNEIYEKVEPKNLNITTKNNSKTVFAHQIFSINLIVDSGQELNFDLQLKINSSNLEWLNKNPEWNEFQKGKFSTILWFQAQNNEASITNGEINLYRNSEFIQKENFEIPLPEIKELETNEYFCDIVADELQIQSIKSTSFDEKSNLIILELNAKNTDLSKFHLNFTNTRQNIENLKGGFQNQKANYFIILPKSTKELKFNYFNLKNLEFMQFEEKIQPQIDTLSTQISLNPKENNFRKYKSITIYILIVLFLIYFIINKKSYYALVIAILLGIYAIYDAKPFNDGILKANSNVKILPTKNSSIFYQPKANEEVTILMKKNGYCKILLKNQKIGWVKDEDIK